MTRGGQLRQMDHCMNWESHGLAEGGPLVLTRYTQTALTERLERMPWILCNEFEHRAYLSETRYGGPVLRP